MPAFLVLLPEALQPETTRSSTTTAIASCSVPLHQRKWSAQDSERAMRSRWARLTLVPPTAELSTLFSHKFSGLLYEGCICLTVDNTYPFTLAASKFIVMLCSCSASKKYKIAIMCLFSVPVVNNSNVLRILSAAL
jgi:hypothetical protein